MSVACGVEYGGGRTAGGALLPQIIGNIQTVIGCGTLRRGSGTAVQVRIGDLVCQGDVIETATNGQIGIRFIDGTAFNVPSRTRVALCAPKSGSLGTDTPVGSIRGRAYAGGFEVLSLTALTFAMMKEVQAADPNVTFIDEDSIAY
jgi:hypothetical protein